MEQTTVISSSLEIFKEQLILAFPIYLVGLGITAIFLLIIGFVRKRLIKLIRAKSDDVLLVNFFNRVFQIGNIIVSILLFLTLIGKSNVAGSILGAATLSTFVIGFALKDIGENFLAGVIMAFDRPFKLGDIIRTGDVEGTILQMKLRDTHVKTFDGKDVSVPNSQIIKNPLFNYTIDGYLRQSFVIGVDYDADLHQVQQIIKDTLYNVRGILKEDKKAMVFINDFSSSALDINVYFWIDTFDNTRSSIDIKNEAMYNVLCAIRNAGISIPGNVVEVKGIQS